MNNFRLIPLLLLAAACANKQKPAPQPKTPARIGGKATFGPPESMIGISGLTKHETSGLYYAVSEREPTLFPIEVDGSGRITSKPAIPIENIPEGVDLEAVAFLDDNTIVFGTESKDEAREADAVLYASFTPERVKILDERTRAWFDYRAYGIRPDPNRGVEGLCAVAAKLVAAGEQVIEKNGLRIAPLQVYDPLVRGWQAHELVLTSDDGKIAGLTCNAGAARTEVVAIERHYGTVRIVKFTVPLAAKKMMRIRAELVADLGPMLGAKPKNYEGIVRASDGLFIINDNSYGSLDGPTELLQLVGLERPGGYGGSAL